MPSQPDLIIWGAHVRTLDPHLPACTAMAVKDGAIVATGDDDAIRAMRGPGTRLIDGRGIAFVPGLTDAHIHPLMGTIRTQGADLFDAMSLDDIRQRLITERNRVGPNAWVQGWGLHYEPFEEAGIRGDHFDEVVGGQPMLLEFFDGHTALANRSALELAGIYGPIAFEEEATVVCIDGIADRRAARVGRNAARPGRGSRRRCGHALPVVPGLVSSFQPGGTHDNPRHGRHSRRPRHLSAARGERRSHMSCRRSALATTRHDDGGDARPASVPQRSRAALALRRGEVFYRRRDRDRDGVARRPRHERSRVAIPSGPNPSDTPRRSRFSPGPVSSALRTRSATAACKRRSTPTRRPVTLQVSTTGSSISSWYRSVISPVSVS